MSGRREPFHQPVEEGVVAALALADRALNQVVARDERGAGGQGRRLARRRVDVLALLALHPARQPLQQFLARLKEFARPTSGAAGLNGLGQKTKRQREVRLVLAQRLEQVFAEIPIGIRPPGDAQFHRKTPRIGLAETRREALDGLGGPRQRRLPVLVDKGQQAFGQARQVPVGNTRLIGVSVAALRIDRTEHGVGLEALHKGAGAVVDRLAA